MTKRVAITGFSFRFPGTTNSDYWQDLLDERDLVTEVNSGRWEKDSFLHPNKNHPGTSYTFAAGSIGDITTFDAGFFGISPREAIQMDPQQRLLLEMSWEALENSGIKPSTIRGSQCGVFIGIAGTDHAYRSADDLAAIDASVATGNNLSIAANRISYVLDLQGPSMAIDTACSSSMVAFHQACRSILSGESTQALTGGVSLHMHPYGFIIFAKASMLSPRGRCNPFDADADGYVRSEGGGVFFLKDYDQAIADGNPILAVVANSAINTDGKKSGLTLPNSKTQAALLNQVYSQAGIDPATIDYIEAHGTGTAVGDPVEVRAIGEALGKLRPSNNPLRIGSIKSNLGHLEAASAVAGLVKALYCIRHRLVPATIGIKNLNPNIPFDELNIEVITKKQSLKKTGKLVIGINSFGFGGANAHVILESHEPVKLSSPEQTNTSLLPIILWAKDPLALKAAALDFSNFLKNQPESALYNIAYNAVFSREWHEHRAIVYGTTTKNLAKELLDFANDEPGQHLVVSGSALKAPSGPAFIYSGNGSQWAGMGKRLLEEDSLFRDTIREIDAIFSRYADFSLEDELAGRNGEDRYQYTEIAQPALFALQVGITRMLQRQGIMPVAVTGHSVGEVAAAWASGALSLEAAVAVIYHRSELQGMTKGKGAMTAVALSHEATQQLLDELNLASTLTIAGINSSRGVTIAGSPQRLGCLESALNERNIFNRRLDLDYAFHSPIMDEIESGIKQTLAELHVQETLTPFYSTVTGALLNGTELNATYWWHNIRKPVLFEQAIKSILSNDINIFIEIGPHAVLRSYINDCVKDLETESRILSTINRNNDNPELVWKTGSQALIAGINFDWSPVFSTPGQFIQLPNYPWQRERHWHPVTPESIGLLYRHKIHPLLGYPLQQHDLTWENQLDTKLNPSLADHVVGGAIVFPGAGFSELALAAALAWHPDDYAEIEDLEIHSPLLLSADHTKVVRLKIEAQDGSLTIKAREYGSTEPWTVHAVGRILTKPGDILLRQEKFLLPADQPDFNGASHKALTDANGLTYGPAFQCIDYGWVKGNSVLATLKIPDSIEAELEHTHLHPALLDCTFQLIFQLLKDNISTHADITFVPTKISRIAFRSSKAKPGFARATLLRQTQRSLTTEFTIFDTDSIAIAVLKGVQFRSIRLSKNAADHLRFLTYHSIPIPHAFTPDATSVITFENVKLAIDDLARRATLKGTYRRYTEEVEPLLDSLCSRFTRQALQLLSADGKKLSAQDIFDCQNTNPEIVPFLSHLLTMAEEDQVIALNHNGWEILPDEDTFASAQDIWNSLVADYPDYFQIIHSVGRIGMHLKSLLDGSLTLAKICPQESSLTTLTRQILGAKCKQKIGLVLRDLITKGINKLSEGQRLGLIEISDGSPSFAMDACIAMDSSCCDYIFASTSVTTLEDIAQIKEQFPGIDTRLIDNATEQPIVAATCQIAIITLDFNALECAIKALEHARASLLPGGVLIIVANQPSRWIDFVFGGQYNHWYPAKNDSWLSNQRTNLFWELQLQQLNFSNIETFELSPNTFSGSCLLVAQRDESVLPTSLLPEITPRSWIILADKNGYSAELSNHLTAKLQVQGDLVIQACPDDTDTIELLLLNTRANYGLLDGIIYLAGLVPQSNLIKAEAILDQQVSRCTTAANIIQACENTQTNTTCWLITTGAATNLLPKRSSSKVPASAIICVDAALWGFGRTLINEASTTNVRLIDLENPLLIDTVVTSLAKEFDIPDDEQEIILTGCGARYAPRLYLEPGPDSREHEEIESPTINLGFQFPGQLRNLRWEAQPRRITSEDEIEVEVHASGLNFRDVMYALGLLSDEAIENGFSGPTLGLEFSGIVQAVGSKTSEFSLGDRVVGFGPSSFGNRVITQANAISLIPPGISFEAAATIPSTFFTVYYALHHLARLQPGEKILIHGAAGGVGIAAIQIAKWMGAEIYATAGSDEKRDFLQLLGVEHIFDSRSLAFADEIMAQTDGKGIDVILNSLAGEAINRNFQILKPFGRFLELGKRDFYENTKIGLRPFRNNISYFGIDADQLLQIHSGLTHRLFTELMALFSEGILHPLPYHAFEADDIVDAFRYMQQARQIGKIVITYRNGINNVYTPNQETLKELVLPANVSYLVTGGLSGFGLRTAQWLVSKGARNLVLISRSGPSSDEAKIAIDLFEKQGVKVYATSCDITDKKAISVLFTEIANSLPPIKGIVHAATVINDGLIRNMDAKQIRSVLEPKALGAYYLHEMTIDMPLDFFILFSSATTLFGNPGQGNYVAANACLEALAQQRRINGLPATCIAWGAIDDVGFLARNKKIKEALQNRMGGSALNSGIALDVLESMLMTDRSNLGVMELDWKALSRFLPSANSPKFSELARHTNDSDGQHDNAEDIQQLLLELSDADLLTTLTGMIKSEVGEILRVSPDKIDPTRSIYDMGLDSLMGVELIVALESRFGTRLPVMALSESPTITKLAERIIQQLKGNSELETVSDKTELLARTRQIVSQHEAENPTQLITNLVNDIQTQSATSLDRIIN
ncbi:type I polyketide synthase [Methylobacter psychrophilus]|uniref:type I polyketide synthase n=1 Tax=Methylobacter psychrophilus TaxID=96941 RepID=UPI0021D4D541|nr:type I polyketide synthase [Methylobacter psychrophilus]